LSPPRIYGSTGEKKRRFQQRKAEVLN